MALTGKGALSLRKKDLENSKSSALGYTNLIFAHKCSGGETGIDLTALIVPTEMSSVGFVNPSVSAMAEAKIKFFRRNLRLKSSARPELIDFLSYDIATSSRINFIGFTALPGEIFVGILDTNPKTNLLAVDAQPVISSGPLLASTVDYNVGIPFKTGEHISTQVGSVLVFKDGIQQFRNANNALAAPSADGNYQEIDAGGGLGVIIRFNVPDASPHNILVFNPGLAERPDGSMMAVIENLAGQLDRVIPTVAGLAGVPPTNFQSAPNSVDLKAFGDQVYDHETRIETIEALEVINPVGSLIPNLKALGARTNSGGTVIDSTGSWLTFNSGASSTGRLVYNFTPGLFTVAPFLTAVAQDNGVAALATYLESITASSVIIRIAQQTPSAVTVPLHIIAIGY